MGRPLGSAPPPPLASTALCGVTAQALALWSTSGLGGWVREWEWMRRRSWAEHFVGIGTWLGVRATSGLPPTWGETPIPADGSTELLRLEKRLPLLLLLPPPLPPPGVGVVCRCRSSERLRSFVDSMTEVKELIILFLVLLNTSLARPGTSDVVVVVVDEGGWGGCVSCSAFVDMLFVWCWLTMLWLLLPLLLLEEEDDVEESSSPFEPQEVVLLAGDDGASSYPWTWWKLSKEGRKKKHL